MNHIKKTISIWLLINLVCASFSVYARTSEKDIETVQLSDYFGIEDYSIKFMEYGTSNYVQFIDPRSHALLHYIMTLDFTKIPNIPDNGISNMNPLYIVEIEKSGAEDIRIFADTDFSVFFMKESRFEAKGIVHKQLLGIIEFICNFASPMYETKENFIKTEWLYQKEPPIDDWAAPEIGLAIENGIIPPFMQNNYGQYLSKNEFCELLLCFMLKSGYSQFNHENIALKFYNSSDIEIKDTFSLGVIMCYEYGIISKTSESALEPDKLITRREALEILKNTAIQLKAIVMLKQEAPYYDQNEFNDSSMEDISWARGSEVMLGYPDNYFYPDRLITRKEAFVTIQRLYKCIKWPLYKFRGLPSKYDFSFQYQSYGAKGYKGSVVPVGYDTIFIISPDIVKVIDAVSIVDMTVKGKENASFEAGPKGSTKPISITVQISEGPYTYDELVIAYITLTDGHDTETYLLSAKTSTEDGP